MPDSASQKGSQPAVTTKSDFWAEVESLKSPKPKTVSPEPKPEVAEKTYKALTTVSEKHRDVHCVAVSHSSPEATEHWISQVGGAWQTDMIVDNDRDLYARWGLGLSNTWHAFNPKTLYSVYRLGVDEGIWNRPTESGSRWQKSAAFAVDEAGTVRWRHISNTADDLPNFDTALEALGIVSVDEGKA
ncbi:hypothetical protein ED733_005892 [Metarhizium rileyi]|uniref:Thioredoxin-like fold protein n=1 Tax=Metarhizium rileyi (strain RCEF 4871) TaxID=1649241 RepID=A0A5C6GAK1_METRR|nr:hypothetical protein ED733_005892 [Metarhizium rileyi]